MVLAFPVSGLRREEVPERGAVPRSLGPALGGCRDDGAGASANEAARKADPARSLVSWHK